MNHNINYNLLTKKRKNNHYYSYIEPYPKKQKIDIYKNLNIRTNDNDDDNYINPYSFDIIYTN